MGSEIRTVEIRNRRRSDVLDFHRGSEKQIIISELGHLGHLDVA